MTFSQYETSRSLGQPDTLYRFQVGDTVYAYTDAEEPITSGTVTYQPVPIDRDQVSSSGTLDKSTLKISFPTSLPLAELFRVYPPSDVVTVTIFQGHWSDPEYLAVWSGRVLSCDRAGMKATVACEPVSTSMRRPGLRRRYQRGCPHVLYGPQCREPRAENTVNATVVAIDGPWVTVSPGWNGPFAADRFAGGILKTGDGEERTIQKVQGDDLLLGGGIGSLETGDTVALSLGCAHTTDACQLFGNILNYGGQPWIPIDNPFANINRFG